MTRNEAKRWIREHWSTFIRLADCQMENAPPLVFAMWSQECQRIAMQIDGRSALDRVTPDEQRASMEDGR